MVAAQGLLRPSRIPASASGEQLSAQDYVSLNQELGWPLGHVRLHTDEAAQKSATARGVRGLTIGSDIYPGPANSDTDARPPIVQERAQTSRGVLETAPRFPGNQPTGTSWDFSRIPFCPSSAAAKRLPEKA